jgi:16S rRNA C1402 (ribose-2'-O) methylase RsmI
MPAGCALALKRMPVLVDAGRTVVEATIIVNTSISIIPGPCA